MHSAVLLFSCISRRMELVAHRIEHRLHPGEPRVLLELKLSPKLAESLLFTMASSLHDRPVLLHLCELFERQPCLVTVFLRKLLLCGEQLL